MRRCLVFSVLVLFGCGAEPFEPVTIHHHHEHEAPPEPEPTCVVPVADDPGWGRHFAGVATKGDAVTAAKNLIGERCGEHPEATLRLLADALNQAGECAGFVKDGVMVYAGDEKIPIGFWEEYHSANYTDGCWRNQNPEHARPAYRFTHRFDLKEDE